MSDEFTDVTTQGWLQRIGGSFVVALIGLIVVPASVVLLYWNEGRAVDAIRALGRGAAAVVEVSDTVVTPQTDGKLVHVSGMMQTTAPARDPVFGVTGEGVLRLSRAVEMYQWREATSTTSQQSVGGSKTTETTYTYQRVWSDQPIQSTQFKVPANHQNPPMPLRSAIFDSADARLGVYKVDPSVLGKLTQFIALRAQTAAPVNYQVAGDGYYHGQDPSQPAIGDLRVAFTSVPAQTVSVAAALTNGVLTAYRDANRYGIALIEPGVVTAAALFQDERKSEGRLTWILRGVGFVTLLVGLIMLTRPLTMLFAVLPFLESLVGAGAFLVSLTLAIPITLATIAIAWIVHRPAVGVGLLVAAVAMFALLGRLRPSRPASG